jgi:LmbE family N-acetylglucosaminyl deacetylase
MAAMPRGTLVSFHAHPDDEAIATGGTLARAADEGHRVVLVVATRGEHGEVDDGFLDDGETLWERRVRETEQAADILGIARVEFLGYTDSGMAGTPENDLPGSFWTADVDVAAARLAAILRDEQAEVLTTYDDHGGYDHPDHIQVHRVGARAAALAGVSRVYEATINRDHIRRLMLELREQADGAGIEPPGDLGPPEELTIGVTEDDITTTVDVAKYIGAKRAALAAHRSQVDETSFFLAMPAEQFLAAFGEEWFIRRGDPPEPGDDWLF